MTNTDRSREAAIHEFVNDQSRRRQYYFTFKYAHRIAALLFFCALAAMAACAGAGVLQTKTYWTISALKKNALPPPKLITSFEIFHNPHLYWIGLSIFFIGALYHTVLGLPVWMGGNLVSGWVMSKSQKKELEEGNEHEYDDETDGNHYYYSWYQFNVIYGGSGIKHIMYGITISFFTLLTGVLVGVTDFLLLSSMWLLTLLGYLCLWHIEYRHGKRIHINHKQLNKQGGFIDDVERALEGIEKITIEWTPFYIAIFAISIPIAVIVTYFAIMLHSDTGAVKWFVWVTFICYIVQTVVNFGLLMFYHLDFAIFHDYMALELFLFAANVLILIGVTTAATFGPHNEQYLYAIST